jgi:hypothetical protein
LFSSEEIIRNIFLSEEIRRDFILSGGIMKQTGLCPA